MKKVILMASIIISVIAVNSYALESSLLDVRNKIFEESKEIKPLMENSKDLILVSGLWDACIMTVNQMDAYFSMLGIFNTIKKEDYTLEAVNYLINWLNGVKKVSEANIQGLNSVKPAIESETKTHMVILKNYYLDLSSQLASDIEKLLMLKKAIKPEEAASPAEKTRTPRSKK